MSVQTYFVTGTDTGVGKTFVTCGLIWYLRDQGLSVGALKPVETGCQEHRGALLANDASLLSDAIKYSGPIDDICPYRFRLPLSPEAAAGSEGVRIDLNRILDARARMGEGKKVVMVEGAGGLLVPLTDKLNTADLISRLKAKVILVVASKIGCINHTLLTLEALDRRGIKTAGIILNRVSAADPAADPSLETNLEDVRRRTKIPVLGEIPHLSGDLGAYRRQHYLETVRKALDESALKRIFGL
ncbi:MAG: dethiobiotin synthase [Deltaproteobacteria bacterium]|nr:dethiobiotin synthase [Deltaproteobacteria bacterium]